MKKTRSRKVLAAVSVVSVAAGLVLAAGCKSSCSGGSCSGSKVTPAPIRSGEEFLHRHRQVIARAESRFRDLAPCTATQWSRARGSRLECGGP